MKSFRLMLFLAGGLVAAALLGPGAGMLVGDQSGNDPVVTEPTPSETPVVEESTPPAEDEEEAGTEGDEAGSHGALVSRVAHCAPRGKDPLFEQLDQDTHGDFVRAAAHGDTISVGGESYDLSTEQGVEDLCDALDEMREQLETEDSTEESTDATTAEKPSKGSAKSERGPKGKDHK